MPRQIDLRPQNLKVTNNPNNQLGFTQEQIVHLQDQIPAALEKAELTFINSVLAAIDQATGLDLEKFTQDALTHITYTGNLASDLWNYYVGTNTTANNAWTNWETTLANLGQATIADFTAWLSTIRGDASALQSDFAAGQAAFATLVSSWYTTLTTTGQTWPTALAALDSAWHTYLTANSAVTTATSTTITQLISNFFGFDPTTGQLAADNVGGLADSFDQLAAALQGDAANAGQWAWLATIMTSWFGISSTAHSMAVDNTNTLSNQNNKPLSYGLDDTTEANISFAQATTAVVPVAGTGSWAFVRCQQESVKNTIAFITSATSTPTSFTVYTFQLDFVAQRFNYLSTSANLASQLTSAKKWLFTPTVPTTGVSVKPGDVLAVLFLPSTSVVSIYGTTAMSGTPVHPNAQLPALSGTLNTSVTLTAGFPFSSITFNNTAVPYVGLEVSSPPPPVYPDHTETYTATRSYTINSWAAHVDLIGVGAGGGGEGETGAGNGDGGTAGVWNAKTLTVGATGASGIAAGGTITVTIGAGGAGGPYFTHGSNGGNTVFSWQDAVGTTQTMTCNGGAGGQPSTNLTSWGLGPGNYTYNSVTYPGGGTNAVGGAGYYPGGGGAGGAAFQYGFAGASGEAWSVERQS